MSGPITAGYFFVHATLLLSARALREAQELKREFGAVREQLALREGELAQNRRERQQARLERLTAMRRRAEAEGARIARLSAFAAMLASSAPQIAQQIPSTVPAAPASDDDALWSAHVRALDDMASKLEALLATIAGEEGTRMRMSLRTVAGAPSVDDVLTAYALQRELQSGLNAGETERLRATAARILRRLEMPEGDAIPAALEALARDIVLAPSVDRAEALASELRHAVQRCRDARQQQIADEHEARQFLYALPDDAPLALLRALERVAASTDPMDESLRASAQDVIAAGVAERERLEQGAAALVVEQSLRDLGYEVEGIEATLFVAGGTVHFRRPGWENYFVRMRVDADEQSVNFNVVRARGGEETPERRRLDALAEDRWCAEFPRLLQTLESRGLKLDVTRNLAAGEVPVQVVPTGSLPEIVADEGAISPQAVPLARPRP